MHNKFFIIDFDSTFVTVEGLEELAEVILSDHPKKETVLAEIIRLTEYGMAGKIAFEESLKRRLEVLAVHPEAILRVSRTIKKKITPSILQNKSFFRKYKDQIYIVSGGFKEIILPVVESFGIDPNHVFANTFRFDKNGKFSGIDTKNPLAKDNGKPTIVRQLALPGEVYVIGDGSTDLRIKKEIPSVTFVAFIENVKRETVMKGADMVVSSFDEFLYAMKLPRELSYPKTKIKVLLLENIDKRAVTAFEKEGYSVTTIDTSLPEEELMKVIKDIHILGIRSRTQVTKAVLDAAEHLYVIGAFCIGTDQIDLLETTRRGIAVFNAPYSNTRSVVELTIGEIIMLARGITEKNNKMHEGMWDKSAKGSFEIRGKTLGIVGYGNIGSQLSVIAENLGMDVIFYDMVEKLALGNAKRVRSLKELLQKSDIVTIHVDGRKDNEGFFSEREFSSMKDGSLFVNNARGKLIDIKALVKALKSGKVAGAAVDVFPKEPKGKDEPFQSELIGLPNVILTPHIGGSTKEAQENIGDFVSGKIIEYMNTGITYLSVSLPNIQLPDMKKAHRVLHMHENTPGVLAHINQVLADNKINILGQYLKTNETVGYVITDVDKKYNEQVLSDLRHIPGTVRVRVLY